MQVGRCVNTKRHKYARMQTHKHTLMQICTCTYTYMYTHVDINMHSLTYTHVKTHITITTMISCLSAWQGST